MPYPPATCRHKKKPAFANSGPYAGLCQACYHRARRQAIATPAASQPAARGIPDDVSLPALITSPSLTLTEAVQLAEQELIAALPEAARALRRAIATNPRDANALKAALALLQELPIPSASGVPRRLLGAGKASGGGNANAQVVIGLHVGEPATPGGAATITVGQVVGTIEPTKHPKDPYAPK